MRTLALCLAAAFALPSAASAQASVNVHFDLPLVLPRLVVVSPGVQVVPEVHEEVFFHENWYWVRREGYWYRSHDHRGGWALVPIQRVPPRLVAVPPGKYRDWKAEKHAAKAERKAARRAEQEGHHRGHGNGHGHGHGDHD
jgi:hypothetical protein